MSGNKTIETYDRIAETYLAVRQERSGMGRERARFAELVEPGGVVLDVGCGPGFDTALLREAGLRAVGFDLSWGMLASGRGRYAIDVVLADMCCLPVRRGVAGLWVSASLLHLPRPVVPATLARFYGVLNPAGTLFLSLKIGEGTQWAQRSYEHDAPRLFTFWQPEPLDALLVETGFTIVDGWVNEADGVGWVVRFVRKGDF